MRTRLFRSFVLLSLVAAGASSASAVVVTPGYESAYLVGPSIPLPGVNAADVVVAGASIFVGQGGFGAGQQSILRVDPDGTATTVVSNLNALGGIAYDVVNDRLLFTDNGGDLVGATNGDTVYALPDPRAVAAAIDAATLTLLPSGSLPFAQAVLPFGTGDTILVGDAAGPGAGRVVRIMGGVPSDLITDLDYVSGLATARDYVSGPGGLQQIFVGNVDGSFTPSLSRYSVEGDPLGPINATPISGALDHATDRFQNLFVTGGFTDDFSSTLTHVVQAGAVETVASGFGFSSGIGIDGPSQRILVLDFGLPRIDTIVRVLVLTPGGNGKRECNLETWGGAYDVGGNGRPRPSWTCTDGDPECDRDLAVNGSCTFQVGACARVLDLARNPKCTPVDVASVTVTSKFLPAAASAIQSEVSAITPATAARCSELSTVVVPADRKTRSITFDAKNADGKRIDKDVLKLRCLP